MLIVAVDVVYPVWIVGVDLFVAGVPETVDARLSLTGHAIKTGFALWAAGELKWTVNIHFWTREK